MYKKNMENKTDDRVKKDLKNIVTNKELNNTPTDLKDWEKGEMEYLDGLRNGVSTTNHPIQTIPPKRYDDNTPFRVKEKNVDTNPGVILENKVKSKLTYVDMKNIKEKKRDTQKNLSKTSKNKKNQLNLKNIAKRFKDQKISNILKPSIKIPTFA